MPNESFETFIPERPGLQRQREPAFFTTSTAEQTGFNRPDREGYVMRNGERVRIKHPQAGHVGEHDSFVRLRGEGARWITVVDTQGNVIYFVLTNGAGDMNPNSEYALSRKQKARALGWYPIGQCPVAMLAAGEMRRGHFADQALTSAQPCAPGSYGLASPCPHALAERAARQARHAAHEQVSAEAHENKLVAAQAAQTKAITDAQKEQTQAIVDGQRDLLQTVVATLAEAKGKK